MTKSGRQIGFWAALSMLVGSVVGIGIFFKNHSVLSINDWNGWASLVSWIIGGVIALSAAISFSEIGTFKSGRSQGLASWAENVGGKKFGYFVRFNFTYFYFPLLMCVLSVFGGESLLNIFVVSGLIEHPHVTVHISIGVGLFLFFVVLNFISVRASGMVAIVTTVLKFLPLLIAALAGIGATIAMVDPILPPSVITDIMPETDLGNTLPGVNAFNNGTTFSAMGLLSALPATLFAYDAFLVVGNLTKKIEKAQTRAPLVIMLGMGIVAVLYILISISTGLYGVGMVSGRQFGDSLSYLGLFGQIFPDHVARGMEIFVSVFIFISVAGVINNMTAATVAITDDAFSMDLLFGTLQLKKRYGEYAKFIIFMIVSFVWYLTFTIPAAITNSDAIIDGYSNFPTLFFFLIYGVTIFLYAIKRRKHNTQKMPNWIFWPAAIFAIIGSLTAFFYNFIYGLFIERLLDISADSGWGLFVNNDPVTNVWVIIMLGIATFVFFFGPLINLLFIKMAGEETPIIDTMETELINIE